MFSPDSDLSEAQSQVIATTIREALARRRMSRQALADHAKISISTLEKALSGRRPFTLATTVRLEEALGVRLREAVDVKAARPASSGLAPDELGSYSRAAVEWIEGGYLTLRPSFSAPGAIFAYRTDITWDESSSRLMFREAERLDTAFTQEGYVAVPNQSGHVYLVTNRHGQHRLVVLSRPTIERAMYGILTTLQAGRGAQLTPIAAPIALVPIAQMAIPLKFGRVAPNEAQHASYREHLDRVTSDMFALFLDGR
jgi:transcriptional regulator with XRE-family HTH domain